MNLATSKPIRTSALYPADAIFYDDLLGLCLLEEIHVRSISSLVCERSECGTNQHVNFKVFEIEMLGDTFNFATARKTVWVDGEQDVQTYKSMLVKTKALGWSDITSALELEHLLRRVASNKSVQTITHHQEINFSTSIEKAEQQLDYNPAKGVICTEQLSGNLINWLNNVAD